METIRFEHSKKCAFEGCNYTQDLELQTIRANIPLLGITDCEIKVCPIHLKLLQEGKLTEVSVGFKVQGE